MNNMSGPKVHKKRNIFIMHRERISVCKRDKECGDCEECVCVCVCVCVSVCVCVCERER